MTPCTNNVLNSALNKAANMSSISCLNEDTPPKHSKLSRDEVLMIKLYYHVDNMTLTEIAKHFNMSIPNIHAIVTRKTHKTILLNFMTKIPEQFHIETNNKYRNHKLKGSK